MRQLSKTLMTIALGLATSAHAVDYVQAAEGQPQTVNISDKEITRVSIEGGYIRQVKTINNEADIDQDNQTGQIFLRPLVKKNISLFITSEAGKNYLLILKPVKKNADAIVLREPSVADEKRSDADKQERLQAKQAKLLRMNSEPYTSQIKQFVQGLATAKYEGDVTCGLVTGKEIPLWKEAMLVHVGSCSTDNMTAQIYSLTNISNQTMVIAEQEFYKRGVLAVGVRNHQLSPNEKTDVFVVTGSEQ